MLISARQARIAPDTTHVKDPDDNTQHVLQQKFLARRRKDMLAIREGRISKIANSQDGKLKSTFGADPTKAPITKGVPKTHENMTSEDDQIVKSNLSRRGRSRFRDEAKRLKETYNMEQYNVWKMAVERVRAGIAKPGMTKQDMDVRKNLDRTLTELRKTSGPVTGTSKAGNLPRKNGKEVEAAAGYVNQHTAPRTILGEARAAEKSQESESKREKPITIEPKRNIKSVEKSKGKDENKDGVSDIDTAKPSKRIAAPGDISKTDTQKKAPPKEKNSTLVRQRKSDLAEQFESKVQEFQTSLKAAELVKQKSAKVKKGPVRRVAPQGVRIKKRESLTLRKILAPENLSTLAGFSSLEAGLGGESSTAVKRVRAVKVKKSVTPIERADAGDLKILREFPGQI